MKHALDLQTSQVVEASATALAGLPSAATSDEKATPQICGFHFIN